MLARLLVATLGLTVLTCAAACASSGAYAGGRYAAAAVGMGAAGAVASRAAGGCLAQCIAGTHCNRASGLCVHGEGTPPPRAPAHETASEDPRAPRAVMSSSYPDGHEYELPSADGADAGCTPTPHSGGGAVACEMDGGTY